MHISSTPAERRLGGRVDVAVGPIARMFAAEDWPHAENAGGGTVFAGLVGEVIENVDREPEPGAEPVGLFNLDPHMHNVASGHPVPHLTMTVTRTRGGEPALTEVPVVLVARPHKGIAGPHDGNNVALEPAGVYLMRVRLEPSGLTGTETVQDLKFSLNLDAATTREQG